MWQKYLGKMVHACNFSKPDYYNIAYSGLPIKKNDQTAAAEHCLLCSKKDQKNGSCHSSPESSSLTFSLGLFVQVLILKYYCWVVKLKWFGAKVHLRSFGWLWAFSYLRLTGTGLFCVPRVRTKHGEADFIFYPPYMCTNFQITAILCQLLFLLNEISRLPCSPLHLIYWFTFCKLCLIAFMLYVNTLNHHILLVHPSDQPDQLLYSICVLQVSA